MIKIQFKWKNLRTLFARELTRGKEKSIQGGHWKTYIYILNR